MRLPFSLLILGIAVLLGNVPSWAQTNDSFANRLTLTGSSATAVSNNLRATNEAGEPSHAGAGAGRSLWYTWTAPTTGTVNLGTYYTGTGAPTMRAVAVYTGDSLAALSEVASSNNLTQSRYFQGYLVYSPSLFLTGTVVNVPVTAGTAYQIAVDALTPALESDDGTVVLSINAPPTVVSAANVTATTGTSFSYSVLATGGPTVFTAANLPAGLSINAASGLISGTPTVAGTYPIGLTATGPGGTGTATLTLRCDDSALVTSVVPVITNAVSKRGIVNTAFSVSVSASGSPTAFTATNLPPGLSLNAATGLISGTPSAAGTYAVPVTATGAGGTGSATLTFLIDAAPPAPIITSTLAASATTGSVFYCYIYTNVDSVTGAAPTAYTASNLPPGLTQPASTSNYFSGTPTAAGVYAVPITVTNAGGTRQATVTVTVRDPVAASTTPSIPVLTSAAAATGIVGSTFAYQLTASNTPTGFTAGNLPSGLALNSGTGQFSGAPTAAGVYSVPVSATNDSGTSSGTLTITVYTTTTAQTTANGLAQPVITSPAAAGGYVGQTLTYGITASYQGSLNYYYYGSSLSWAFSATGLPPGLSVTATGNPYGTGTISGTPTVAGTYRATISATCPASGSYIGYVYHPATTSTATITFVINAAPAAPPVFTNAAAASLTSGSSATFSLSATGTPTSYAASGLPPGMSLAAGSGAISGTPTATGTYPATVSATNAAGTGTATVTFVVRPSSAPIITSAGTVQGTVGTALSYSLAVSSGTATFTVGSLPPGLAYSASSNSISGTPTAAGAYSVPLSATTTAGTASATVTITISPAAPRAPVVTSGAGASATTGQSFFYYVSASGSPTSYGASNLPPGLTIDAPYSQISGVPTSAGTYLVSISATNAAGTGTATLTIVVTNPGLPAFTSSAVSTATVNQYFNSSVYASNSPTSYTFSGLPAGVTADAANPGYFAGTPTAAGVYSVTTTATNVSGSTTAILTLTVAPASVAAPVITSAAGAQAYVGSAFSYPFTTDNNPTSYNVGGLPAGLSFDSSARVISGTPTAAGTYLVTLAATNAGGTSQAGLNLLVSAAPTSPPIVTSSATALALLRQPFFHALATDFPATSYSASGLPTGLSLDTATGLISGKLTTAGTYPVLITATNSFGQTQSTLTIMAFDPPFAVFTHPAVFSGMTGQAFTGTVTSSAVSPTSTTANPLPTGLSIKSATGVISGTPTVSNTTTASTSQYTESGYITGKLLLVFGTSAQVAPVITSSAGVGLYAGIPFTYQIQATRSPFRYSATGLPSGLTLDTSTGIVSGTTQSAATFPVSVTATGSGGTSATAILTFTAAGDYGISTMPALVTSAASVSGVVGASLAYTPTTAYAASSYYTTCSNLPPGLTFNSNTGTVTGTPTAAGSYAAKFVLLNQYGHLPFTSTVTFNVAAAPASAPVLTSLAARTDYVGNSFSYQITAANGPTAFAASNLPTGLTFNSSTGTISGFLTTAGTYTIPISATNGAGTGSGTLTLVVTAAATSLTFNNPSERVVTLGASTSASIYASPIPTSYAASGLPPGLALNPSTGVISGTPTVIGNYSVTVSATNPYGSASAVITYVVVATTQAPPVFSSLAATLITYPAVPISTQYFSATGSPTSYAASGLPPGLVLNSSTGTVSGTPTTSGSYAVNVSATNLAGTGTAVWTVVVRDSSALQPVFSGTAAETAATVGQSLSYAISSSCLDGNTTVSNVSATFTFSGLPDGVSPVASDTSTTLAGAPKVAGTYPVMATVTVPGGGSSTASLVLVISLPVAPVLNNSAGVVANVNSSFTDALSASGTPTGFTCGTLPDGLVFNASSNTITGTPTTTGSYAVNVTVTGAGGTTSAVLTIRVDGPVYGGVPLVTSAAAVGSQDFPPDSNSNSYPYSTLSPAVAYTVKALNGPASFTVGTLPAGLSYNPYTNAITGVPLGTGVFQVPITATNAAGSTNTTLTIISTSPRVLLTPPLAARTFVGNSLNTTPTLVFPSLSTSPSYYSYNSNTYSTAYDPLTYSAVGLPPGLTINRDSGVITGTLTQAGNYPVTLSVANRAGSSSAVETFSVGDSTATTLAAVALPTFYSKAEAVGFVGLPLSYSLAAYGTPTYTATGLPTGFGLNPSTGAITGTPTAAGTAQVTVSATNATGTTQALLTLTIEAAPAAPTITLSCTATAIVGSAYGSYISVSNYIGMPAPTSYATGTLPAGLSLDSATGYISGVPTGPVGTYTVPLTVSVGSAVTASGTLILTVQTASAATPLPVLSSTAGALGLVGNPFLYRLQSSVFAPTSSLPAGLAYNAASGTISGYPSAVGTYVIPVASPGSSGSGSSVPQAAVSRPRKTGLAAGRLTPRDHRHAPSTIITEDSSTGASATLTICILNPSVSVPRLTIQPTGGTALEGSSFTFSAAAVGAPSPGYQWLHNGNPVPGATGAELTFGTVQPIDAGDYKVTAANAAGSVTSATVTLVVQSTYALWQADYFTQAEIAAGQAADSYAFSRDGVPNLLKYAFDLDPRTALGSNALVASARSAAGGLVIAFERNAGKMDINYLVETSTDLRTWMTLAESDAGMATAMVGGTGSVTETAVRGGNWRQVTVEVPPPASGGKQFLRVRIVRP